MIERDGTPFVTTLNRIRADLAAAGNPAEFNNVAGISVTWLMGLAETAEKNRADVMRLATERNGAYRERAQLVAWAAAVYKSGWNTDPAWPDWRVVFVDSPAGQLSWHVAPGDWELFEHVKHDPAIVWDGHTTVEKYERIARLIEWLGGVEVEDSWRPGETVSVLGALHTPAPPVTSDLVIDTHWTVQWQAGTGEWAPFAWSCISDTDAADRLDRFLATSQGWTWPTRIVKYTTTRVMEVVG